MLWNSGFGQTLKLSLQFIFKFASIYLKLKIFKILYHPQCISSILLFWEFFSRISFLIQIIYLFWIISMISKELQKVNNPIIDSKRICFITISIVRQHLSNESIKSRQHNKRSIVISIKNNWQESFDSLSSNCIEMIAVEMELKI